MGKRPWLRYLAIVLGSAVADAFYTMYILACSKEWVWIGALLGSSLPLFNIVGSCAFVEAKTFKDKFLVTLAISLGMFLGSAGALLAFTK